MNQGAEIDKLNTSFIEQENSPNDDPTIEQKTDNFIPAPVQAGGNLNKLFDEVATNIPEEKKDETKKASVFAGINTENSKEDNPFVASANKNQGGVGPNLQSIITNHEPSSIFNHSKDKHQAAPAPGINPFLPTGNKTNFFSSTQAGSLFGGLQPASQTTSMFSQSPNQPQQQASATGGLFANIGAGTGAQNTGLFGTGNSTGLFSSK